MTNEPPTLGELMRVIEAMRIEQRDRHKEITERMGALVQSEVFNREVQRVDNALQNLTSALASETANRKEAVRAVRADGEKDTAEIDSQMERLRANLRWVTAVVVLPVALFIANIVLASKGGGS